jgi:hypothetical protein
MARAGTHDIFVEQGGSFTLHMNYQNNDGTGLTLDAYTAQMQVRRSAEDPQMLLWVSGTTASYTTGNPHSGSVTGGGDTGEFSTGSGVSGTGNITLDVTVSGATGSTGGILVTIDADTMANVPAGRHVYDIELYKGNTTNKLLKGRFEVEAEVTR